MTDDSYQMKIQYFLTDPKMLLTMLDFFLGDHIGSGCSRDVYEYNLDNKYVVKIENKEARGDNWAEWRIWETVMHTEHKKWFAECTWISDCGRIMLQRRTTPLSQKNKPEKVPLYFTDLKMSNFGTIGKQVVCHDYSYCIEMFGTYGMTKRMQKFKCHDE